MSPSILPPISSRDVDLSNASDEEIFIRLVSCVEFHITGPPKRNPINFHLMTDTEFLYLCRFTSQDIHSVRNGLGAPAAPRRNCQEDWTGPDDNFHSVPSWDILGLQV